MSRLRAEYDAIEQAMNRLGSMQSEGESALNQLTGIINDMMDNWEGLAGNSFMSWWSDIANPRANEVLAEFQSLQSKLQRIMQKVQEMDQEASGLFNQE
jgi:WXG100 family type VII secretion target